TVRLATRDRRYRLARNLFQHLRIRREFFYEHEQTLNRFFRFVTGESATDQIDFLKLPRLKQQFLAAGAREKDVDRGLNALIADFSIEHHLHVTGAFELLKDELVHPAAGFDQRCRNNRERAGLFGIARGREDFPWNFHRAGIDTAAHGPTTAGHRIVKRARGAGNRIEQNENVLTSFDQTFSALDG